MIKLGVIGYGKRISSVIKECLRAVDPDVRVVGIVDPDEEGVRSKLDDRDKKDVKFYGNMKEMISKAKPDALAIGTRCKLHAPFAMEAAKYDIPLYLEKPVATSMTQATGLEKAFEKSKCPVVVSFPLKVSPLCLMTKELLTSGAVGKPEHITATNYVNYGIVYWQSGYHYRETQGLFLQKATHDLDYMMHLMGSPVVRVAGMMCRGRIFGGKKRSGLKCSQCKEAGECLESPLNRKRNCSNRSVDDHLCLYSADCGDVREGIHEDSSSALVEFASGAHGVYTQVFYSRRDASRRGAIISGYMGTVDFDWYRNDIRYVRHHSPFTDTVKAGEGMSHFGGDFELACDFIDIIKGRGKSRTTIWDGIQSVYACLAAKESSEKGVFVKVRQVGKYGN